MHPKVARILAEKAVRPDVFSAAVSEAVAEAGDEAGLSARMQMCAALAFEPDGSLCDVGGSVALYLLVLKKLGMTVTIVDTLPYLELDYLEAYRDKTMRRVALFERHGIRFDRQDAFAMTLPAESFDVACAFETIEHFPQSPKPVLTRMRAALKAGGRMCLSVPNVARFSMRMRVLAGRSPHESYGHYFEHGNPYLGHHREMTVAEVAYLADALGLRRVHLFTTNLPYEPSKPLARWQRALRAVGERTALADALIPAAMRERIWLDARKPG